VPEKVLKAFKERFDRMQHAVMDRHGPAGLAGASPLWHRVCIERGMEVLIVFAVIGCAWILEITHMRSAARVRHRKTDEHGRRW
jgi:hypothetical protein